ncbi:MAG: hypothetical protein HOO06_10030 [Bdellovibrionaceae bacterium]|nr:hypothetical protein [Pseudobdellovibrionaceae bacterium]
MMRITFLFLLTALSCSVMARLSTDKIPPMLLKHAAYWRGHLNSDFFKQNLLHPDLWKKSKIITSVKIQKKEYGLNVLQLKSIGVVNAPIIFVFKHLLRFKAYKDFSMFVTRVNHLPLKQQFYIRFSAFNYVADLKIKYKTKSGVNDERIIFGEVVEGVFKGLHFELVSVDSYTLDKGRRSTRVQLKAVYGYAKLPIPEIFVNFGFEVVMEKLSATLKAHIERKYNQALKSQ